VFGYPVVFRLATVVVEADVDRVQNARDDTQKSEEYVDAQVNGAAAANEHSDGR